jgi:hypothetical protein
MWPEIDYFNAATAKARNALSQLELIDRYEWHELYRHKTDGSYWRIDAKDKYQQRFIVHVPDVSSWKQFDSSPLQRSLLMSQRGGTSDEQCFVMGCKEKSLKGLAFCVGHAYERGIRK